MSDCRLEYIPLAFFQRPQKGLLSKKCTLAGQGEDKVGYMKAARTAAAEALRDLRAFYMQTRKE